jgi:hypothetical protein
MLCIANSQTFSLFGYSGGMPHQFMSLKIALCNSEIGCGTQAQSQTFMMNYLTTHTYFQLRLFLVDTVISPAQAQPVSRTI